LMMESSGLLNWEERETDTNPKYVSTQYYLYRGTESWVFGEEIDGHKFGFSHDFFGTCPSNGTSAWTVEVSNNEGNSTSLFPEEVTFTLVEDPRDQLWILLCDVLTEKDRCNSVDYCAWKLNKCQTCKIQLDRDACYEANCIWIENRHVDNCIGFSENNKDTLLPNVVDNDVSMSLEFIFVCTLAIMFSLISIFIAKKILTQQQDGQDEESPYRGATDKEIDRLDLRSFKIILDETVQKKKRLKKRYMKEKKRKEEQAAALQKQVKRFSHDDIRRVSSSKDTEPKKRESETRRDDRRIPRLSIQSMDSSEVSVSEVSEMECVICMCEFEPTENLRVLPCGHFFHVECVRKWLVTRSTCPFCRKDIADT